MSVDRRDPVCLSLFVDFKLRIAHHRGRILEMQMSFQIVEKIAARTVFDSAVQTDEFRIERLRIHHDVSRSSGAGIVEKFEEAAVIQRGDLHDGILIDQRRIIIGNLELRNQIAQRTDHAVSQDRGAACIHQGNVVDVIRCRQIRSRPVCRNHPWGIGSRMEGRPGQEASEDDHGKDSNRNHRDPERNFPLLLFRLRFFIFPSDRRDLRMRRWTGHRTEHDFPAEPEIENKPVDAQADQDPPPEARRQRIDRRQVEPVQNRKYDDRTDDSVQKFLLLHIPATPSAKLSSFGKSYHIFPEREILAHFSWHEHFIVLKCP